MAFQARKEVFKITEMRDGCIFRTRLIGELWVNVQPLSIEQTKVIANSLGGDILADTMDSRIVPGVPEGLSDVRKPLR